MSAKKNVLAAWLLCSFGVAAAANIAGDATQNETTVKTGPSGILPFGSGKPGLSFNNGGSWSNYINLENGPIKHIRPKYGNAPINGGNLNANVDGSLNPLYIKAGDVNPVLGWFITDPLGQIWYENRANNTEVYSVRQMANPSLPMAPKLGGLVMAKVPGLPADGHVYFGEWAPRAPGATVENSTDLNRNSDQRTVWYVGENPTTNMPTTGTASYTLVGVNKHVPGQNDFYTGTVTATYGTGTNGTLAGGISRGTDTLNFNNVQINNMSGKFYSVAGNTEGIKGQFFGSNAAAMAGIATRGTDTVGDDVAFGGKKH